MQLQFPLWPENAIVISETLAMVEEDGRVVFFNSAGPIFTYAEDDALGKRHAMAMLTAQRLVSAEALARAMGVSGQTVRRNRDKYLDGGLEALIAKPRPRKGYKLAGAELTLAQELLDAGASVSATGRAVGVSEGCVRAAIKTGKLVRPGKRTARGGKGAGPAQGSVAAAPAPGAQRTEAPVSLSLPQGILETGPGPSLRSAADAQCSAGVAVKRIEERTLAMAGRLTEAPMQVQAAEAVPGAGVLLALPAVLDQGLFAAGEQAYGHLKKGFFGLCSVLLLLTFMALLRIRTPEQLKAHAPGELGLLLGLDRAPEVKTLRRKLAEIGAMGKARHFADALARRWARPEALGYLYVDGHVRPYHGRKYKIPKTWSPQRRLCMPATSDTWVNDAQAQPWFFVTAEANDDLLSMLENAVLPKIRDEVGAGPRPTVVFDRGAWSPAAFQRWSIAGFDIMTYRKGRYAPWPQQDFVTVVDPSGRQKAGKPMTWKLAEKPLALSTGGGDSLTVREVRRLCDNGHQTSIVTTRTDLSTGAVAARMFARWRQENYFKYMRQEYALDHRCSYAAEAADPDRPMANPQIKALEKSRKIVKKALDKLRIRYGELRDRKPSDPDLPDIREWIGEFDRILKEIRAGKRALPKKVSAKTVMDEADIVRLEIERKRFTDLIRMIAYRAESAMLPMIAPLFMRDAEEGRTFLKAVYQLPADMIPRPERQILILRFHSMANPRFNRALAHLCENLTAESHLYPGTQLRFVFQPPALSAI